MIAKKCYTYRECPPKKSVVWHKRNDNDKEKEESDTPVGLRTDRH